MNKTPEEWSWIGPSSIANTASPAACTNILRMAQQDIAEQAALIGRQSALIKEAAAIFEHINMMLDGGGTPVGVTRVRFNAWLARAREHQS